MRTCRHHLCDLLAAAAEGGMRAGQRAVIGGRSSREISPRGFQKYAVSEVQPPIVNSSIKMLASVCNLVAAAAFALSVSLAPVMTNAVSTCSVPGLSFVPINKPTMMMVEEVEDFELPTPPLTRSPSVQCNNDDGAPNVTGAFIVLEDVARGQTEEQPAEGSWFVRNLTTALMLAVRFLVGPLDVRTRQGCGGDDESRTPRSSLWEKAKATARKALDKAKEKIRDVGERFRGLFDDPIARTTRLLALVKRFKVRDMPGKPGHKRHDSAELFERDRSRLGADAAVACGEKQICSQLAKQFPEVGYNQGFDAACKAILECVGGNNLAATQVFTQWAVPVSWLAMNELGEGKRAIEPAISYTWSIITKHAAPVYGWLSRDPVVGCDSDDEMVETIIEHIFFEPLTTLCSRLGFSKRVMDEIIEETMKAGVHGPAVTLFVVMALLCAAEEQGAESANEVAMVKVPLKKAAKTVCAFKALEDHAPISLMDFVAGYREAMAGIPAGAEF